MIDLLALADRLEELNKRTAFTHEDIDLRDAAAVLRRVQKVLEWCDRDDNGTVKTDTSTMTWFDQHVGAKAHVRSLLQPPNGVD